MSLVEIARYQDVYEADLAAAFLASHGVEVDVTERFQTTVDPLMQRALGLRLMGRTDQADAARDLLARVTAGEFATTEGDDLETITPGTRVAGTLMALAAFACGGFWGSSLPRRFRPVAWQGILMSVALLTALAILLWVAAELVLNPP
ncbi:hypothetical protein D3C71_1493720 [compost metagenome]